MFYVLNLYRQPPRWHPAPPDAFQAWDSSSFFFPPSFLINPASLSDLLLLFQSLFMLFYILSFLSSLLFFVVRRGILTKWVTEGSLNFPLVRFEREGRETLDLAQALNQPANFPSPYSTTLSGSLPTAPPHLPTLPFFSSPFVDSPAVDPDEQAPLHAKK